MIVTLQDEVTAEIVLGTYLPLVPRWDDCFRWLIAAPWRTAEKHERFCVESLGSGDCLAHEWDELLFGQDNKLLRGIWFHVPETDTSSPEILTRWLDRPPLVGSLRLGGVENWGQERTDHRWLAPSGDYLAGVYEAALTPASDAFRLQIAPDLDLLFADGIFRGWLLTNPTCYMGDSDQPRPRVKDSNVVALVHEYLNIVSEPNIDAMLKSDPKLLAVLEDFHTRVKRLSDGSPEYDVLLECVEDMLDYYYDKKL